MRVAKLCLTAGAIAALSACAHPAIVLPPADLATCADEPTAPDLPAQGWTAPVDTIRQIQQARDAMMLTYALALREAWGDCRAKVDGLAQWRESAKRGAK